MKERKKKKTELRRKKKEDKRSREKCKGWLDLFELLLDPAFYGLNPFLGHQSRARPNAVTI